MSEDIQDAIDHVETTAAQNPMDFGSPQWRPEIVAAAPVICSEAKTTSDETDNPTHDADEAISAQQVDAALDHTEMIPTATGEVQFARGERPEYAHVEELPVQTVVDEATTTPDKTIVSNDTATSDLGSDHRELPPITHNDIVFDETHYYRLRAGTVMMVPVDKYVSSEEADKLVAVLVEGGVHDGAMFPAPYQGFYSRYEAIGNNRHLSRLFTFKKHLPGDEIGSYRCLVPSLVAFVESQPVMSYDLTKFDQAAFDAEFISIGADPVFADTIASWTGAVALIGAHFADHPLVSISAGGFRVASIMLQHGPAEVVGYNGVNATELISAAILAMKMRMATPSPSNEYDTAAVAIVAKLQEAHDALNALNAPPQSELDEAMNDD